MLTMWRRAGKGLGARPAYEDAIRFSFIAGVIKTEDRGKFQRTAFRATRGNCLMHFESVDNFDEYGNERAPRRTGTGGDDGSVEKAVPHLFRAQIIETKLKKICDAFGAQLFSVPDLSDNAPLSAPY